jgi:hypothetical protein
LDKDGETEWGVAALLAEATMQRGTCTYAYAPSLREKLYNPRMYARLCLSLQNKFASKYALTLWELCTDYLGANRDVGETPWITLEHFRLLMGLNPGEYRAFRDINKRLIAQPLTEMNRLSDFCVTVAYQYQGRKVTARKFTMRRVVRQPEPAPAAPPPCPEASVPPVVRELQDAGLSRHEALDIWHQRFAYVTEDVRPPAGSEDTDEAFVQYVREKIHLLQRRQAAGKIEHTTGFLREAIRKNYANPEYAAAQQHAARRVQQQTAVAVEHQRQELAQQKAAIEAVRDRALQALCDQIVAEEPEMLEQAAALALHEMHGFHLLYDRGKTARDNYQARVFIQALVNPYLEHHASERFAAIRQRYAASISAVETHIAALQT